MPHTHKKKFVGKCIICLVKTQMLPRKDFSTKIMPLQHIFIVDGRWEVTKATEKTNHTFFPW